METPSSTSSTSSGGGPDDSTGNRNLNAKYQKLAAEYAKLRSQSQVLKKAIVEEQQKHDTLKSTITSQDQAIRKLEQELDSVKFRNRQLEKRIEILQESDSSSPQKQAPSFDANLLLHVEQNKQLQESLAQLNEKYMEDVGRLRKMIDNDLIPRDLLDSLKQEHDTRTQLLKSHIQNLTESLQETEHKLQKTELENEHHKSSSTPPQPSQSSTSILQQKLLDSEQSREKLNSEVQILRLKLKRLSTTDIPTPDSSTLTSPIEEKTNMIGRLNILEEHTDKDLIIGYLSNRNGELVRNLQEADSKAVFYYYEAVNLCRLVRTGQLSYKRLDSEFDKLKVKYRGLCDEMDDVKRGYNEQVVIFQEHIASLNNKLMEK